MPDGVPVSGSRCRLEAAGFTTVSAPASVFSPGCPESTMRGSVTFSGSGLVTGLVISMFPSPKASLPAAVPPTSGRLNWLSPRFVESTVPGAGSTLLSASEAKSMISSWLPALNT